MQSGKLITFGVWLMILFNLLLSFGAVWSLQRMNPEIQRIYERNIVSLDACENMLLLLTAPVPDTGAFARALQSAENNITESGEKESITRIKLLAGKFTGGDQTVKESMTREIIKLTNFNKNAIMQSAMQAQKMRQAGAWGIVFMTLFFFAAAIFFEQKLRRRFLLPFQEISSVMDAHLQGDHFRRCNLLHVTQDMKKLFMAINDLLDSDRKNA